MGRVRTKTVKRASRVLIEKYYPLLTLDFEVNKRVASDVASIPSKRLRNKIAGFTTHLMKRIRRGPVRGISFKLQEEERERKDNYVPDVSALAQNEINIDSVTAEMLKKLNIKIKNAKVIENAPIVETRRVVGANFGGRGGSTHGNQRGGSHAATAGGAVGNNRRPGGNYRGPNNNNNNNAGGNSGPRVGGVSGGYAGRPGMGNTNNAPRTRPQ